VCNILAGIHLSWCVDGLDSGRVLLHLNHVLCLMGNVLGIQISLLLQVYLSINVSLYCGVDQTKQQSNTRFSL
jgi:hypothetical protein